MGFTQRYQIHTSKNLKSFYIEPNIYWKMNDLQTINKWKNKLGIPNWDITTERITPGQIEYSGEEYFIGITRDFKKKKGIIYHDIDLYEEAIIHELLHVRYPTKNEDWVNKVSRKLLNKDKLNKE